MRRARIVVIVTATAIAIGVLGYFRFSDPRPSPVSQSSGASPMDTDPAMTSESVPQLKEDGIVPLPTDAVGRSLSEETR